MIKRNIELYLRDILNAINSIEKFVEGMNINDFKKDDKTVSAVIRKFEIIGEASKNIPKVVKNRYISIPWNEMAAFRDKLIHFYFGINYEIIWNTIKINLPELRAQLEKMAKDFIKGDLNE